MVTTPSTELLESFVPSGTLGPGRWARAGGVEYVVPVTSEALPFVSDKRPWRGALADGLLHATREASGFLDVGTGFGYFAALVCRNTPQCAVHAVDGDRELLEFAAANLDVFPNASLHVGVVGQPALDRDHSGDRPTTGVATLLELVEEFRSDVVLVGVEGREVEILQSLRPTELLQDDLTVFAAVRPGGSVRVAAQIAPLVAEFRSVGFDAFFLHENGMLARYTDSRLHDAARTLSRWCDYLVLVLSRGRYLDALLAG
jgi:SAM-dependent methyltransferase